MYVCHVHVHVCMYVCMYVILYSLPGKYSYSPTDELVVIWRVILKTKKQPNTVLLKYSYSPAKNNPSNDHQFIRAGGNRAFTRAVPVGRKQIEKNKITNCWCNHLSKINRRSTRVKTKFRRVGCVDVVSKGFNYHRFADVLSRGNEIFNTEK